MPSTDRTPGRKACGSRRPVGKNKSSFSAERDVPAHAEPLLQEGVEARQVPVHHGVHGVGVGLDDGRRPRVRPGSRVASPRRM